jgi:hypothetical protein
MAAESLRQSQRSKTVQSRKQLTQMRGRRKKNLEKKAYEFNALCDADVCLGIRIRCYALGSLVAKVLARR